MNKRQKAEETKLKCAKVLGVDSCFVCGCKKAKGGMTIHHLEYEFDDVIYKNYDRNDSGKLKYYTALLKKVEERPERFMYLCNKHHQILERLNRYNKNILRKILLALSLTKTK